MKRICIFCASSTGANPVFAETARSMGAALARQGHTLVYGGGHIGLMGVLADAELAWGSEVIGVIPEALVAKELAHNGLTDLRIVDSMHERKALMADLADAFLAMPGGFGTLDEFCEILTWAQLGLHRKPCGLLNANGFFDPFLEQIESAVREGFIREQHRDLILVEREPEPMLKRLGGAHPPDLHKWIDRDQT